MFNSVREEIPVNYHHFNVSLQQLRTRAGFWIADDFDSGTYYIRVAAPAGTSSHPVPYTIHVIEDTDYIRFLEVCRAGTQSLNDPEISDPLYACQWHLTNPGGEDVNVEGVWREGNRGEGVNIAIVDNGMDFTHEDLTDNVDSSRNHDYTGRGDIHNAFQHHGTHLAGIVAARDNDLGVRGLAPGATMYGYNLLVEFTDLNVADAMTRNGPVTAVSNNSWGPIDGPAFDMTSSLWEMAVNRGLRNGFDGKGTFYAFAGGNGHLEGDSSNLDEYANYYGVTAVCAVNRFDTRSDYSETGANLWVCAPSNDSRFVGHGIVTTENSDRYIEDFGGTSAATPVVSGVAALMRSANPDLTWRDLKLILAASARQNDPGNPGWEDGASKYGVDTDGDGYHFNHEYGFGVVDAGAAVQMAKAWDSVPPLEEVTSESGVLESPIPDAASYIGTTTVDQRPHSGHEDKVYGVCRDKGQLRALVLQRLEHRVGVAVRRGFKAGRGVRHPLQLRSRAVKRSNQDGVCEAPGRGPQRGVEAQSHGQGSLIVRRRELGRSPRFLGHNRLRPRTHARSSHSRLGHWRGWER